LSPATKQRVQQQQQTNNTQNGGGRRPKLSEKMKSLSLDCADMPPPVQMGGIGRNQYFSTFFKDNLKIPLINRNLLLKPPIFQKENNFVLHEAMRPQVKVLRIHLSVVNPRPHQDLLQQKQRNN